MRSGNQRFSFGFVITLFILGCIVGFLSNYKDVFKKRCRSLLNRTIGRLQT